MGPSPAMTTALARGADSAYPPSSVAVSSARAQGVVWWGGYLGGPAAYNTWPASDFRRLVRLGLAVLPIWVPNQSPPYMVGSDLTAMLSAAARYRVPAGCWLALDAEPTLASWLDANPSVAASAARATAAAGWRLVIYGHDQSWDALWRGRRWPDAMAVPGPAWQWAGSATSPVAGVDADVARQTFLSRLWGSPSRAVPSSTPPPQSPRSVYDVSNLASQVMTVRMTNGRGIITLPSDIPAASVVSVVPLDTDPATVGAWGPVPMTAAVATSGNVIVVNGPPGTTGDFGLLVWSVR